jgi:hypothetical protein
MDEPAGSVYVNTSSKPRIWGVMHAEYMYTSNFAVFETVFLLFSFNLTQTLPWKCNMQLHAQLSVSGVLSKCSDKRIYAEPFPYSQTFSVKPLTPNDL